MTSCQRLKQISGGKESRIWHEFRSGKLHNEPGQPEPPSTVGAMPDGGDRPARVRAIPRMMWPLSVWADRRAARNGAKNERKENPGGVPCSPPNARFRRAIADASWKRPYQWAGRPPGGPGRRKMASWRKGGAMRGGTRFCASEVAQKRAPPDRPPFWKYARQRPARRSGPATGVGFLFVGKPLVARTPPYRLAATSPLEGGLC